MSMASNGQTLMQMPQPMHNSSEMSAILSLSRTMHSWPLMFTGHSLMHSSPHFLVWQRSRSTTATLCTNLQPPQCSESLFGMGQNQQMLGSPLSPRLSGLCLVLIEAHTADSPAT